MRIRKHHIAIALAAAVGAIYLSSQTKLGPNDIYPHGKQTGYVNPDITQKNIDQTICNPNWTTKSIRPPTSYTNQLKLKQIKEYGYKDTSPGSYEEDHLVALVDGGNSTDERNLWPMPYVASISDGGAKVKDQLEVYVHKQICSGRWTLKQGQDCLAKDWYLCYNQNIKSKLGGILESDQDDE